MGHSHRPWVVPANRHFRVRAGPTVPFTQAKVIVLIYSVGMLVPLGLGIWLVVRGLRGGPAFPSCGKCGYDVTGTIGSATRCPECGSPFAEVGIVRPGGKQRPLMAVGGLILIVLAVGCLGTSLSGLMALKARQAQSRAISAQAAAQAAPTSPAVDDAVSSEENVEQEEEP